MNINIPSLVTTSEGNPNAKVAIISGVPSWEGKPFSDVCRSLLLDTARRAGIRESDISFHSVLDEIPPGRKAQALGGANLERQLDNCRGRLSSLGATVFVPTGNLALEAVTGHKSIDKWQLSIIPGQFVGRRKTIPLFHPEQIFSAYKDIPFLIFGMQRIAEEMTSPKIKVTPRVFHTSPSFEFALKFLSRCLFEDYLSVDIETAAGQITCVGFAPTTTEAICIPTLPQNWTRAELFTIWTWIHDVLRGPSKKVFQNFIYDASYFSKYGIAVKNLWHDTMLAQKFLHPELPMGLDTIARIYTREPYWKDEGKDWKRADGGSGDLNDFWIYNCKDTTVTLEAAFAQRRDLDSRKLTTPFTELVMSLASPAAEMCWRGLPVDLDLRSEVTQSVTASLATLGAELNTLAQPVIGTPLNSKSPKQVKEFFKKKGYRLPVKAGKESSDATALLKLQVKYPHDRTLPILLQLSEKNKLLSSYLKPLPYPDGRFRFSLNLHGAETGRWSCRKDPWDNGINAQTISSELKKMFRAPPGWLFFEVDLRQADSRFVAWDAPEPTLIKYYSENLDIHRFVASRPELFNKALDAVTKDERQLGKKVGHASNYGMRGNRLSEICLLEMDLVLSATRADQMLEGYHRVFPGIRMWQQRIAAEVRRTKKLTTPLGRERYFYDRLGDDLYRVAYAYRPQSTVIDVINKLIVHAAKHRNPELCHFALQAHDAAIFLVHESYLGEIKAICAAENDWNPELALAGGLLRIPIEAKVGEVWGNAKELSLV